MPVLHFTSTARPTRSPCWQVCIPILAKMEFWSNVSHSQLPELALGSRRTPGMAAFCKGVQNEDGMTANTASIPGQPSVWLQTSFRFPDRVVRRNPDTLHVRMHPEIQPHSGAAPCQRQKKKRNPCRTVTQWKEEITARAETREWALHKARPGLSSATTPEPEDSSSVSRVLASPRWAPAAKPPAGRGGGASAPPPPPQQLRGGESQQAKKMRHVQTGCASGPQLGALAKSAYVRSYALKRHTCSSLRL